MEQKTQKHTHYRELNATELRLVQVMEYAKKIFCNSVVSYNFKIVFSSSSSLVIYNLLELTTIK